MRFSVSLVNAGNPLDIGAFGEILFSRIFVNLTGTCVDRLLHERPSRSQWPQRGNFSSHFFFRATQVRHPVLDFNLVVWAAIVEIGGYGRACVPIYPLDTGVQGSLVSPRAYGMRDLMQWWRLLSQSRVSESNALDRGKQSIDKGRLCLIR